MNRGFRRRRALLFAAALLGAALLGLFLVDLQEEAPTDARLERVVLGSGRIRAGAGRAEVALPDDPVLAGYRPFGRPAGGDARPLFARALLLEVSGKRVALVLVELLTLPEALAHELRARLTATGIGCALVTATHSHSGPGGYDPDLLPQLAAIGRYDAHVTKALVDAVAQAIERAQAELQPATLRVAEASAPSLNRNRDDPSREVDERLLRIELQGEQGAPIAQLVRFAAHPTIEPRTRGPSGDWPSTAMAALEENGGVAFVLPGAVGDAGAQRDAPEPAQPPNARGAHGIAALDEQPLDAAQRFGARVATAVGALEAQPLDLAPIALGCAEASFVPPEVEIAAAPSPLRRAASNLLALASPEAASVTALRLGRFVLLGVPAEPTFAVAREIERAHDLAVRTVALSQGHLGYAPTSEELGQRVQSSEAAFFGAELGKRLQEAGAVAVEALAQPVALPIAAPGKAAAFP